jgi:hypothetical protein
MTSLDDVLPRLAYVKVFSMVDTKNAFWHLKVEKIEPFGRYKWLRLAFGLSVAREV